jgi:hypothetical protein
MSNWSDTAARVNTAELATFGEPVVYQAPPDRTAVPVSAIRLMREAQEAGIAANFEGVAVNPADFANPPVKGDWVTVGGQLYLVTATRQPDPYGLIHLTLIQAPGQANG